MPKENVIQEKDKILQGYFSEANPVRILLLLRHLFHVTD